MNVKVDILSGLQEALKGCRTEQLATCPVAGGGASAETAIPGCAATVFLPSGVQGRSPQASPQLEGWSLSSVSENLEMSPLRGWTQISSI